MNTERDMWDTYTCVVEVTASVLSSPSLMSPESGLIPTLAGRAAEEGPSLAGSSAAQPRSIWTPICPRIRAGLLASGGSGHSRLASSRALVLARAFVAVFVQHLVA